MPIGNVQVPVTHVTDEPTKCIPVNVDWIPALLAMVAPARFPEFWAGTLEENRRARLEVQNLMSLIALGDDCNMAICCEPQIYIQRINPDTGRLERSSDGGGTWTTDPTDPINNIVQQPPIVRDTVNHTKCDAASNFKQHFEDVITGCSENLGTAVSIVQLAGGIAALLLDIFIIIVTEGAGIAIVTTITGAIFSGISAAFAEGKAAFDAYWTSDNKDKILCAAYCTIGDNGQWTQTGWEDFKHKARADLPPGAALDMVLTSVNAAGYVGANNMASYGAAALEDCTSCLCSEGCASHFTGTAGQGTIIDRGDNYVTIQSQFNTSPFPYNMARLVSDLDTPNCCTIVSIELLSGASYGSWSGFDHPDLTGQHLPGTIGADYCAFQFELDSAEAPFVVKLTFVD